MTCIPQVLIDSGRISPIIREASECGHEFKEVQAVCEREGLRLWGLSLCGPMVVADVRTKTIATSQPAPEGPRPQVLGIVNAPLEWGGVTWATYMWENVVNRTPRERKELFLHELFHGVVQGKLGLIPQGQGCS